MSPVPSGASPSARIRSIDLVRGAVMVLMAVDHVRVYAGVPAGSAEPAVFFTRWVTHFCAPVFVFLAGTAAFLHGRKLGSTGALRRWLVTRGLWLVVLELTVVRLTWTFNFGFDRALLAGVLWAIGSCMVALGLLVRWPVPVLTVLGGLAVAGHNLTALAPAASLAALLDGRLGWLWRILYFGGPVSLGGGPTLLVLYSFVPWIGVMALGYAFGTVVRMEPERRRRVMLALGLGIVGLFLVLRGFNLYGDRPWTADGPLPAPLAFLNTTKYPASLLFLAMTLGPAIALLPLFEQARGRVAGWLEVFGRVPFFYYLLHIPLIHAVALAISIVRTPEATAWLFADHPAMPGPVPDGYEWSLPLLYAVAALVVVALYVPCRRFAELKARRRDPWLSYL